MHILGRDIFSGQAILADDYSTDCISISMRRAHPPHSKWLSKRARDAVLMANDYVGLGLRLFPTLNLPVRVTPYLSGALNNINWPKSYW